ncbi:type II secretion system protein GspM [Catenovulum maritimum]|uniref:MSHA biogenesis protein MshJ n=1 Tax=Catenovulum maritimum TaxID=1513271 RepID=A0A0J8GTH2_9ALTE|nr:type II secretion system protein GspM [Catenovulum maritimum]KMT66037.1 hypothetical protein XM47_06200 [Catenovulum maritimum]
MNKAQQQWQNISEKYTAFSIREKVMILSAGLVFFLFGGFTWFIEPTWQKWQQQQAELTNFEQKLTRLNSTSLKLQEQLKIDVNLPLKQQIEQLNQNIELVEGQIQKLKTELISAEQMTQVLESMLIKTSNLKIISLAAIPSESLLNNKAELTETIEPADKEKIVLYQHGIKLKLEGRYEDIYQFLKQVESLPWRFYWQNFDYSVETYPNGILTIEIISLSLTEEFIGL